MNDQIIFFDFEYTAWEGSRERKWSEPWEHREIIQIAAIRVVADHPLSEMDCFDRLVKPKCNPILSEYIINLTGLTQADVDTRGESFPTAFAAFFDFFEQGRIPIFCYGDDLLVLRENLAIHNMMLPALPAGMYDIRAVYEQAGVDTRQYTSGTVYQAVGAAFDLAAHNALNDVRSLAITIQQLLHTGKIEPGWTSSASSMRGRFPIP